MDRRMVSSADVQRIIGISKQAASKGLEGIPYTLTKVDGSDRPVKMYEAGELPQKWRERIEKYFEEGTDGRDARDKDNDKPVWANRQDGYDGRDEAKATGDSKREIGAGDRGNNGGGEDDKKRGRGVQNRRVRRALWDNAGADVGRASDRTGNSVRRVASRQPSLFATDPPHIADPKKLTTNDKVAIIAYLNASPHQNNAIAALNREYQDLNLSKQRACAYKAALRKHGTKGLEDNRGRPKEAIKADITLIKQAIYASGATHISSGFHCYCMFYCRRKGIEFDHFNPKSDISDSTFRRAVERLKRQDKQIGAFLRVGKDGIKDLYPALKRHWNRVNQEWQVDATPLDFFVLKNGEKVRPMVVAIVDCYSGARVWGMYDSATSLSDVRLLKKAIESFGLPELIRGDNGADYLSAHFQSVLSALGIGYHAAQAGKGRQKGKIERSFGSVQHSWLENLPGFIGHNVKERSALEAQEVEKLKKLHGAKTNVKCLAWETMQSVLDEYLAAKMEASGAAKKYRLTRERGEIKTVENISRYLGKAVRPTVSAKGAQAFGRMYGGYEFWMNVYIGQKVTLREDIDDVSRAHIFDKGGEYICEAIDSNFVSISAEEAKEIMARHKAKYISPAQKMIKASQEEGDDGYEEIAKRIAEEIREKGKVKLQEKLRDKNKTAANKTATTEEEKKPAMKPYRPSIQEAIDALAG